MSYFKEKCAVVTGAGMGIGEATAILLAENGASVIVSDVNEEAGNATVELIKSKGGTAKFIYCDVADRKQVGALMVSAITAFGPVKMAVNNAGIGGVLAPMHEIEFEDWDKMMAVNLSGVFYCMKEEINAMLHHGGGTIVNVSSLAGLGGMPGGSSYCAAKHGVIGLTKSAALEYGGMGIRVNAVCPGWTDTNIIKGVPTEMLEASVNNHVPMKRLGTTEEIGDTILWLLGDKSSFVNGASIRIDGGMKAG
jgi:NAD(P)-dependent dehydrogenase (short-subunit alcohol dehydrogenase family)